VRQASAEAGGAALQARQLQGLQKAALWVRLLACAAEEAASHCCQGRAPLTGVRDEPRYGVVTCYSMQMFIFLLFVGMVLSGSYPLVRPAHPPLRRASTASLPRFSGAALRCRAVHTMRSCDDMLMCECLFFGHTWQPPCSAICSAAVHPAHAALTQPAPEQHAWSASAPVRSPGGRCCGVRWRKRARSARPPHPAFTSALRAAQVSSWELLDVNWTAAKTQHFRACYWMAWLLAGCFQATFLFLLLGKSLLARLFAEPMELDEPIACAPRPPGARLCRIPGAIGLGLG